MGNPQALLVPRSPSFSIAGSAPALWLSADRNIGTSGARKFTDTDKTHFRIPTQVRPGTGDFWMSFWAKRTTLLGTQGIISTYSSTNNWSIYFASGGSVLRTQIGTPTYDVVSGALAGAWYHLVLLYDRDGLWSVYVNNVLAGSVDISAGSALDINGSYTGLGNHVNGNYFHGSLSRCAYGTGLLTADDIAELYNQGNGKFFAELSAGLAAKTTHYWNLNEGGIASPAYDACGTNDGVVTVAELLGNTGFETAGTNGGITWGVPVATRARASNVATLTTSIPHGLVNGNVVYITAMTEAGYNASGVVVTRVDDTTFTYANTGSDEGATADTTGRVGTSVFGSWALFTGTSGSTINRETTVKDAGSNSCRLDIDAANGTATVSQTVLTVGNRYTASVKARSSAASGKTFYYGDNTASWATPEPNDSAFTAYGGTYTAGGTSFLMKQQSAASASIYLDTISVKSAGIPAVAGPREATAVDLIGGYHGVLTNMDTVNAWSTDTPNVGSCVGGYSLEFDGTDDVVKTAVSTLLPGIGAASTLSAWIKPTGTGGGGYGRILDSNQHLFNVQATARLGYRRATTGTEVYSATSAIQFGQWTHVAVTSTAAGICNFYVNGVLSGTADQDVGTIANGDQLTCVGNKYDASRGFAGRLDDVRVYSAVLSTADIATLAAGGEPATAPTARWTLDDGPQYGEPSDGDPICTWESRDASRLKFDQTSAALRPTYDQVAAHGKPAIAFADQYLAYVGKLLTAAQGSVFIVALQTAAAQDAILSQADVGAADEFLSFGCQASDGVEYRQNEAGGTEDRLTGATAVAAAWKILEFWSDGSTIYAAVNGTLQSLTEASGANSGDWGEDVANIDNTVIGGLVTSAGLVNGLTGAISEILCYDRALTAADATKVRRTMAAKYGVTL